MKIDSVLEKQAERLRLRVIETRASGEARYGESLACEIAQCLGELRESGVSWKECKVRLGVSSGSLSAWRKKYSPAGRSTDMVRVRVTPEIPVRASSSSLLLCTPNGHTLSGLSVCDAIHVLRALA